MKKSGGGGGGGPEKKYGISGMWRGELKGYSLPQLRKAKLIGENILKIGKTNQKQIKLQIKIFKKVKHSKCKSFKIKIKF
jgi:hypothetical protein